ncbi:MAG: hypothetical protein JWM91_3496 [Rhodospirillales bacterium]|nr:hypothetical protein [Rhodospirillales bacterium]
MPELTPEGRRRIEELAHRYGTSAEATMTLLQALVAGGGTMAQFSHPDLGGMGQWSQGGMTMVGDMFNNALKAKVDGLCVELAGLLADQVDCQRQAADQRQGGSQQQSQQQGGADSFDEASLFVPAPGGSSANWWGADLGRASSTGSQNAIRYAYFPASRRLAIEIGGQVTFYDTGDHQIGGVSQQQSGDARLTFVSQHGSVRVSDLPVVPAGSAGLSPEATSKPTAAAPRQTDETLTEAQRTQHPPASMPVQEAAAELAPARRGPAFALLADQSQDILLLIERLAALREKKILSEEEFSAKKAELLARL